MNKNSINFLTYSSSALWSKTSFKLTHSRPVFKFITPWNARKSEVFWYFQGVWKWNIGLKWVNKDDPEATATKNYNIHNSLISNLCRNDLIPENYVQDQVFGLWVVLNLFDKSSWFHKGGHPHSGIRLWFLTYSSPIHPFSTHLTVFWCFQRVEKGCIGNEWVNINNTITRLVNLSSFFQGADIKLVLEGETLKLVEPKTKKILHTQPIAKMRVWGVGRVETRSVRNYVP